MSIVNAEQPSPKTYSFEKDVRPILKEHCFHCHGENGKTKGGVDLRLKRFMVEGEAAGTLAPHRPDESELYKQILSGEMPYEAKKLKKQDIQIIKNWISQGAKNIRPEPKKIDSDYLTEEDMSFWSFKPIADVEIPRTDNASNPIDAFLLKKLQEKSLSFSKNADKLTLLRRASFDLTGLPPTLDDIDTYLNDPSPSPYETLVNRLLNSPKYGERWGRHWLDVVGYSDSEGYSQKGDVERLWAWRYRDYVIRAFNEDKPFDLFIKEQLAGDEMMQTPYPYNFPNKDEADKLTATGFLRMSIDGTGLDNDDTARNKVISETLKIVSASFLGLTVGCAECHDHRFDPISQKDYYRFRAIFEPAFTTKRWIQPRYRVISLYSKEEKEIANAIEKKAKKLEEKRVKTIKTFVENYLVWKLSEFDELKRVKLRAAFYTPVDKRTKDQQSLLKDHPTIAEIKESNFIQDDVYTLRPLIAKNEEKIKVLKNNFLEEFKKTNPVDETNIDELLPVETKTIITGLEKEIEYWKELITEHKIIAIRDELADLRATKPIENFARAIYETPGELPLTKIFQRGSHNSPGDAVPPAELNILSKKIDPIPSNSTEIQSSGRRLAFAESLTDGSHPLSARVIVNRIWYNHFGKGIVNTLDDFGLYGDRPSHPELLDWLANYFMESGWSVKKLHHLIMTSKAYQQISNSNSKNQSIDPENRLLSRMPIRKMDAESVRDSILQLSHKLTNRMYGSPVQVVENDNGEIVIGKRYIPKGERNYKTIFDLGEDNYARSIYLKSIRTKPFSLLNSFDMPTMEETNCSKRVISTVAPQALLFMNSDFLIKNSKEMASVILKNKKQSKDEKIADLWKIIFTRKIEEKELNDSRSFILKLENIYIEKGNKDHVHLSWAAFCQALMSSNRFVYIF